MQLMGHQGAFCSGKVNLFFSSTATFALFSFLSYFWLELKIHVQNRHTYAHYSRAHARLVEEVWLWGFRSPGPSPALPCPHDGRREFFQGGGRQLLECGKTYC